MFDIGMLKNGQSNTTLCPNSAVADFEDEFFNRLKATHTQKHTKSLKRFCSFLSKKTKKVEKYREISYQQF